MTKRFFAICFLWCAALLPVRGEDNTLNHVYRSLGRLGSNLENTFTEDSDGRPSPTPRRHRKSTSKHLSSKKTTANEADSTSESPTLKRGASGEETKSKPGSESSTESKKDGAQTVTGEEEPGTASKDKSEPTAPPATLKPEALREFSEQPAEVQRLIRNSLALTEQNLSYKYGSADPAAGGMDCSGFIYYVLTNAGFKDVPRDSPGQYAWVRKNSDFRAVLSRSGDSFELDDLKPGDLMFWSGTYKVDRDIPITHVMIYLGKEKSTGNPVMVGSTDGRTYDGVRRYGVSVFDFKMPSGKPNKDDPVLTAKFEGYASIPGLREVDVAAKNRGNPEEGKKSDPEPTNGKVKPTTNTMGEGD
jgi:cell wall-associated NlpC family hydrolase